MTIPKIWIAQLQPHLSRCPHRYSVIFVVWKVLEQSHCVIWQVLGKDTGTVIGDVSCCCPTTSICNRMNVLNSADSAAVWFRVAVEENGVPIAAAERKLSFRLAENNRLRFHLGYIDDIVRCLQNLCYQISTWKCRTRRGPLVRKVVWQAMPKRV